MSAASRKTYGYLTLLLIALAFVVAIVASNSWMRGVRVDLTENDLYTLGDGTQAVLDGIEEPINLYLFFSDEATANLPTLRAYATRVREMLEEFAANAPDGKLVLNVVDPLPFSEDEDRAEQFGLQAANVGPAGEAVYFGLAGSNSVGTVDRIPFFQPEPRKEAFLEYDLARLIYNLATTDKTVVGLLTAAPITGGIDPQTQQPSQPWVVVDQAKQLLEVRTLPASVLTIESDVDVLWIVHPQMFDDGTLYAIDQFVMRGGRALIFVDPAAEILPGPDTTGLGLGGGGSSSTLDRLFSAWGVDFNTMSVVTDNRYGLSVGGRFQPIRHIGLIGLDAEAMSQDDPITSGLSSVNLGVAGYFALADGATAKLTPLLSSSVESEAMPADRFLFLADPAELLNGFTPGGKQLVLAARLEGPLKTAFPEGAPANPDQQEPINTALSAAHLAATDNANLVLVGDVDILSDRMWVQAQNFLGQRIVTAFANNGDFVINALDNLSGSAALIGLRSRATYTRPFTTVEELRRRADLQFRETEQRLEAELTQTEQRLGELQAARNDGNSLLMSPEQQTELQRFRDEQVRIRQELRGVRRNLDADIDRLGTWLMVINIALVPVVLTILALGLAVVRAQDGAAMSKRTVGILLAAFVVLLVLVMVGQRESGAPAGTGAPLIAGLEDALGDIERVTVTKANGETVATLEKRPDSWVVSDKHGYVANAGKLRQALTALGEARILEQKTANAELYPRLGVEDVAGADATGISIALTAAGRELPTVILGNAEGAKFRYARRAGEAQSFLIDRNPDVPRTAGQWVESQIVDVRSDRVREVTITHPDGETVRISKTAPELANFEVAGVPNGRELSYPGVANVIGNALRELNLEDVEPADTTPAGEATQVELRTFDGLVVKISGLERDNESWITLEASADPAQAPATPPPAAEPAADGAAPAATPTPPAAAADPSAEAARINARVSGWRYKIAGFQYDQLTRHMADLLKAPPAP